MARKPSDASHNKEEEMEDINLSPIMALLVILIPMLLMMFNFYQVGSQPVAAPKLGTGAAAGTDNPKKPLNLTVGISKTGFTIKQTEELQWEIDEGCRDIRKDYFTYKVKRASKVETHTNELNYNFPKLYACIAAKKNTAIGKEESTINLAADNEIPWHVVARTIDAVRARLEQDSYTSFGEYISAESKKIKTDTNDDGKVDKNDKELDEPMFDRVVFGVVN